MDKFLEKYNLPKRNEEEAENLNKPITDDQIEAGIKKLLRDKSSGPDGFTGEFYKTIKEELTPILHRLFQKNPRQRKTSKLFLWSQNHPDAKTRQRHKKERKLEANITDEYIH